VADPIPACAVMIMDLFLLESIAELVAFVAVVCCPVGADGKNGGGGPSPFPGALPRAFTWHTLGVLLPSRWALGVNDERDPGALPRAIVWHTLGVPKPPCYELYRIDDCDPSPCNGAQPAVWICLSALSSSANGTTRR